MVKKSNGASERLGYAVVLEVVFKVLTMASWMITAGSLSVHNINQVCVNNTHWIDQRTVQWEVPKSSVQIWSKRFMDSHSGISPGAIYKHLQIPRSSIQAFILRYMLSGDEATFPKPCHLGRSSGLSGNWVKNNPGATRVFYITVDWEAAVQERSSKINTF